MTSEFSHDPVKLRVIDLRKGNWKQSYVYVGEVPKDVEQELRKLEKNVNLQNSAILKKFYGVGWRHKLGVHELGDVKGGMSGGVKGGDDATQGFEIDDDLLANLGDISLDTGMQETKNEQEPSADTNKPEKDELISAEDMTPQVDFLTEKENTLEVNHAGGIRFISDTYISPADNILEFKLKIFISTGIPIYRQHVWFKYRERSYPLHYTVMVHNHVENIDIERLITFYKTPKEAKGIDDVNGIPIEVEFYNSKDFLHISAKDPFELLRNIFAGVK
jgi:hypothetical protein